MAQKSKAGKVTLCNRFDLGSIKVDNSKKRQADYSPLPVRRIISLAAVTFHAACSDSKTNKIKPEAVEQLGNCYKKFILNAQTEKEGIPVFCEEYKNPSFAPLYNKKPAEVPGMISGASMDAGGQTFCIVFRGDPKGQKSLRSDVMKITVEKEDKEILVPVVSYKVFQAIISVLICHYKLNTDLEASYFCAKALSTCRDPEAPLSKLGVIGHTGMNFVAQFKYTAPKDADRELTSKGKPKYDLADSLPRVAYMLILACKIDEVQKDHPSLKLAEMRKKPDSNLATMSTLDSCLRSCGLTEKEVLPILLKEGNNLNMWNAPVRTGTAALTLHMSGLMSKLMHEDQDGTLLAESRKEHGVTGKEEIDLD